jgi:hypothetical protein
MPASEKMRLTADGDLGIGRNDPLDRLNVHYDSQLNHGTTLTKGTNTQGLWVTNQNNNDVMAGIHLGTGAGTHFSSIVGCRTANSSHWGTHLAFYTHGNNVSNLNTATEKMRIDGEGRVTMPSQPAFWVRRNGDQTGYHPGYYNHSVIYNYKEFDVGNDVSTTTGLFTAPVSGVYIFFASAYSTTHSWSQAWFTFNGGRYAGTDFVKSSTDSFVVGTGHMRLAAGDTIGFHPYAGGSNATIRANVNHTWFRGSLIG